MFEQEHWESIEELPHYLVSDLGRIRKEGSEKARKVYQNDKGFVCVVLYGADSKTRYLRHVARLVLTTFVGLPDYRDQKAVWHRDGDLTNCAAENLQWDTLARVREWNDMHRLGQPRFHTPRVRNNRTGVIYENALEAGLAEGYVESDIIRRVERQARHYRDDDARYRYIYEGEES